MHNFVELVLSPAKCRVLRSLYLKLKKPTFSTHAQLFGTWNRSKTTVLCFIRVEQELLTYPLTLHFFPHLFYLFL